MKQFQFNYENNEQLFNKLKKIKQWCDANIMSKVLFQIYAETFDHDKVQEVCDIIRENMPDALYMGCSSNGNIVMGDYNGSPIAIICTIFEYPTTKVELFQFVLDDEHEREVTSQLIGVINERDWVKSIMLNAAVVGLSMTSFCEDLSRIQKGIEVFGGVAYSDSEHHAFVFSSVGELTDFSVVFVLIGGEDYYVTSDFFTGWKPLGRELYVTRSRKNIVYEIDGEPAFNAYYRYLHIPNDDNFAAHTLEFPFLCEYTDGYVLRAPTGCNADGSLSITEDIKEDVKVRIAYGDPWTIMNSVYEGTVKMQAFEPEVLTVFSCAARRSFWGDDEVGRETGALQSLAPTSGFYTLGEFLRNENDNVIQHNVTLVVGAHREGPPQKKETVEIHKDKIIFSGKVSMISRLATFVQVATEELEKANEKLRLAAITDSMTGLFNRGEIQNLIFEKASELESSASLTGKKAGVALIMLDIDHFKKINDTYGHKEGDTVLKMLAKMMREIVEQESVDCMIGRWGGEEFMVLLPEENVERATQIAGIFRETFAGLQFPNAEKITISLGVTEMIGGESADKTCIRVDGALYEAKNTGRNRVVVY